MTLNELKGKYARLSIEIEELSGRDAHSRAKLARLMHELEEIDREFVAFRRRAETAPTLFDVVSWAEIGAARHAGAGRELHAAAG